MQACVLHAVGDLRCEQVNDPRPAEGEVLVRVAACGICGSDIPRVFKTGTYRFPLIPGHEFAGEVVAVGDGVDPKLIGSRNAIFPLIPCMECPMCAKAEYALCASYDYLGSRSNGAFAEYVCVPVWNLLPIPEGVSYEEAAMTEPAAVALHALRRANLAEGDSILIFGAGSVGLLAAMWADALGADLVMLADIDDRKLTFAKELGFTLTFNDKELNLADGVKMATGNSGADIVIEASGSTKALEHCMHTAAPFGRVVLLGNPEGDMRLSKQGYWAILRKQLSLTGTWNSTYNPAGIDDWKTVLEFMANGKLNVKPLISHRVGLPKLLEAMELMRDRTAFSSKVMFVNT